MVFQIADNGYVFKTKVRLTAPTGASLARKERRVVEHIENKPKQSSGPVARKSIALRDYIAEAPSLERQLARNRERPLRL